MIVRLCCPTPIDVCSDGSGHRDPVEKERGTSTSHNDRILQRQWRKREGSWRDNGERERDPAETMEKERGILQRQWRKREGSWRGNGERERDPGEAMEKERGILERQRRKREGHALLIMTLWKYCAK